MQKNLHAARSPFLAVGAGYRALSVFVLVLLGAIAPVQTAGAQTTERRVALTFDDLVMTPEVGGCAPEVARAVNQEILEGLRRAEAPATGFVNASRMCNMDAALLRDPLLESWLDAGHVLGNHTWSHPDLEWTDLDVYLADARRGGEAVDSLLAPRGESMEWFRHPLLHAGDTPGKKEGLSRFLEDRGWRVAPVTVDNQEWVYAYVYHVALRQGDAALAARVAEAFLDHIGGAFGYFERRSREVVGREIAQVLLLHANRLVADHIDEIIALIRARGYSFVTLADAVADPAYERGDPWTGRGGPSWIERWAVAGGGEARQGPREDGWVADEFRRLREIARSAPELARALAFERRP
ncbi:MAG: polysaccharide deacetylase family protein [Gemmatimonadota bacterium]